MFTPACQECHNLHASCKLKWTKLLTGPLDILSSSEQQKACGLFSDMKINKLGLCLVQSDNQNTSAFNLSKYDSSHMDQGWLPEMDVLATGCKQERPHECFSVLEGINLIHPRLCLCWKTQDVLWIMHTGVTYQDSVNSVNSSLHWGFCEYELFLNPLQHRQFCFKTKSPTRPLIWGI